MPRQRKQVATIDVHSTTKQVYWHYQQGANFSYNGKSSYHPLLVTLAKMNGPLRTINRPDNVSSAEGASQDLGKVLPLVS